MPRGFEKKLDQGSSNTGQSQRKSIEEIRYRNTFIRPLEKTLLGGNVSDLVRLHERSLPEIRQQRRGENVSLPTDHIDKAIAEYMREKEQLGNPNARIPGSARLHSDSLSTAETSTIPPLQHKAVEIPIRIESDEKAPILQEELSGNVEDTSGEILDRLYMHHNQKGSIPESPNYTPSENLYELKEVKIKNWVTTSKDIQCTLDDFIDIFGKVCDLARDKEMTDKERIEKITDSRIKRLAQSGPRTLQTFLDLAKHYSLQSGDTSQDRAVTELRYLTTSV